MIPKRPLTALALASLSWVLLSCTSEPQPQDAALTLRHTFPAFDVAPGEDLQDVCQSWTLGNDEPVYVNAVRMRTQRGWHHSNWFFTTDDQFDGPDGTWTCGDRDFGQFEAATAPRSGVFFAQSTQAVDETQRFPEGAVVVLPRHARIIGSVHLINVTGAPLHTDLTFEVSTLEPSAVRTKLAPMSFTFDTGLVVPARAESVASMDCELRNASGRPFKFYYVLPHYHQRGFGMRIEAVGGPRDGEVIYETSQGVGDPLGGTLTPQFDATGIQKLRMSCYYANDEDRDVHYANSLDGEMCVMLAYTDSSVAYAGASTSGSVLEEEDADGRKQVVGRCAVIPLTYVQPDTY